MTRVVCVKVGTLYGPEYVNRLAAMIARHTTRPYRFLCLTDDPTGLDVPWAPIWTDLPGWWAKLVLFRPHPALAGERVLFFDLDTVIVGSIDLLFDYAGPFAILRDFYRPRGYGSALMSIAPEAAPHVWTRFTPEAAAGLHGDQDWIEAQIVNGDRWQDLVPGLIGSYKADGLQASPKGFAVCCFHGTPKPHEVDGWVTEAWR